MTISIVLLLEVSTAPIGAGASPLAAQITPAWLASCAAAFQTQLQSHMAPYYPAASGATVRVGSGPSDVGPDEVPMRVMPSLPDAPGAVAYHDDASGAPDEFLGLDECSSLDDISTAISHENLEMTADPQCNAWKAIPSSVTVQGATSGQQIAYEVSDPVQDRAYPVGGVMVSDFVLPAYFDPTISGPTTYMEAAGLGPRIDPFQRSSGGYQLVENADGSGETQVFGRLTKRASIRVLRAHPSSRLVRRGYKATARQVPRVEGPRLWSAQHVLGHAHEALHAAIGMSKLEDKKLQAALQAAHDFVEESMGHLNDHVRATDSARNDVVVAFVALSAAAGGLVLGHAMSKPTEPGPGFFDRLVPQEMRGKLLDQLAALAAQWQATRAPQPEPETTT